MTRPNRSIGASAKERRVGGPAAELGCTVWRLHGQRRLLELAPDDALAAEVAATAHALGTPQLAPDHPHPR